MSDANDHDRIIELMAEVASLGERVNLMYNRLFGDGQPGEISRIEDKLDSNTGFIKWLTGIGAGIMSVLGLIEWLIHRK